MKCLLFLPKERRCGFAYISSRLFCFNTIDFHDIFSSMSDDELLIDSLKTYIQELSENLIHLKNTHFDWTDEIVQECADTKEILCDILQEVNCVEDLKNLDEEDYAFVYECLNEYAEIFIVDGTDERMRLQGEQRFEQLVDLLTVLEADYVPQNWDDEESEESFDDD